MWKRQALKHLQHSCFTTGPSLEGFGLEGFLALKGLASKGLGLESFVGFEGFALEGFGLEGLGIEGLGLEGLVPSSFFNIFAEMLTALLALKALPLKALFFRCQHL